MPRSRKQQPTPVFLPEKFHGQRSLAGYSPEDHKQSDTTEHPYINIHTVSMIVLIRMAIAENATVNIFAKRVLISHSTKLIFIFISYKRVS